jgi:hypothetical protein
MQKLAARFNGKQIPLRREKPALPISDYATEALPPPEKNCR